MSELSVDYFCTVDGFGYGEAGPATSASAARTCSRGLRILDGRLQLLEYAPTVRTQPPPAA